MERLTSQQKESIGLLSIGTFLEYFDLMLYVHMAVLLNELFFPKTDIHTASLLSAFAFCSTFVFRPVGALVFGWIGDNIGRRASLIITTMIMAVSCLIMANLPPYAQIGITASWIITICRIIQGMSSMGEIIGAELYLMETIKPPMQYAAVTTIGVISVLGTMAALGIATLVTSYLFNWRLAFWLGSCIAVVGAVARTRLRETPDFIDFRGKSKKYLAEQCETEEEKQEALRSPVFNEKVNKITSLSLFLIDLARPFLFFFVYVHCSHILKDTFGYTAEQIIKHNFIVSIIDFIGMTTLIYLSYRVYPLIILRVKLLIFWGFTLACPYLFQNIETPHDLFLIQAFVIFFCLNSTSAVAILFKYFPIFKRFTYTSMMHALARIFVYVISSFGLIYLIKYFGYYGLLIIMVPIAVGFAFALRHFEKLEKECGDYP